MRALSFFVMVVAATVSSRADSLTGVVRCRTQAVANAIVYLGVGNGRDCLSNLPPVALTATAGGLVPHVQVARCGGALVLKNAEPTLHVVQVDVLNASNAPTRLLSVAMPYAGYEKGIALDAYREPTLLKVTAGNGEEGVVAYVAVLPHGWAALTDERGRFSIRAAPAGNQKLFLWHETLGTLAREVRVTGERTTPVEIEFGER